MDRKLQDFVELLHRRPTPPRRRRPRGVVIAAAAAAVLAAAAGSAAALLWFPWPGLGSYFKAPAVEAVASVSPATVPAPTTVPAAPRADAVAHAEPRRAPPPAPPAPASETAPAALPPQQASRVLAVQPPLPPVPSLPPPAQQVAMVVPPPVSPPQRLDAVPAWVRNAVPVPPRDARPRIAVVIDDIGLDRARSARAIALPGPLTLAFLPYATDLPRQTETARTAGHELLVHVPMEPIGKNLDAGPSPLDVNMSSEQVLQRLRWDLGRFEGYVGIDNHMGSRFTGDAEALQPVMRELHDRGLLFIDSRTVAHSAGGEVARKYGVPHAGRDVFLDDEISAPAIAVQLAELERVARRNGSAIAIGHPHDQTLEALTNWLRDLAAKGFVLVPVSAIVKERGGEG
jgi:hypothetical protein